MASFTSPIFAKLPTTKTKVGLDLLELQGQIYHETHNSKRPFWQLMTWLLDRRNLENAWRRVSSAEGANTAGIDGETCNDIRGRLSHWLPKLVDDLYHCRYRAKQPRWLDVPKANKPGETRRLGILTVRDRIVHTALKQVLEPIFEPMFLAGSFAFRPGRSVHGALDQALFLLSTPSEEQQTFTHAAQLDIASCFDTIDHRVLLSEIGQHIADPEMINLLENILQAGGDTVGRLWWQRKRGIVQGSPLSPLLCNLYLHPLDVALNDLGQTTDNGVCMLRYADDLLLFARDARLADRGVALIRQVLHRLHQHLGNSKNSIVPFEAGVDWLGVRIRPRPRHWTNRVTFGYVIPDGKVIKMLDRITDMTAPPSDKIDASAFNPARWIVSINEQLRDWRQAYLFADNGPEVFRALDDHTRFRVSLLLQSITGVNWSQVKRQYRVKLPRGFWTWQVPGARLSVLSSLAPHAPAKLNRSPLWMRYARSRRHSTHQDQAISSLPSPRQGDVPALPPPTQDSHSG